MRAFLLAGGRSRRMGRDKALLPVEGQPLIAHMLGKLAALGLETVICGDRPDLARYAPVLPDPQLAGGVAGIGPLAGVLAALEATGPPLNGSPLNLLLAVDMPGIPPEFLRWMADRAERTLAPATVPVVAGRAQPLCAVYRRDLAGALRACIEAGERRVFPTLLGAAGGTRAVDVFDVEAVVAAGAICPLPPGYPHEWFRNLNTPGEFAVYARGIHASKLVE